MRFDRLNNTAWFLLIFVMAISACKNTNSVTKDILPETDWVDVVYMDSSTLTTQTRRWDSIISYTSFYDAYSPSYHMVGSYIDPEMGSIRTGTYTQFRFPGDKLDFGVNDSLRADSLVLSMDVVGYFGRIETPQNLEVYEINQDWDTTKYATDDSLKVVWKNLAKNAKMNSISQTSVRDVRIRLDDELAKKLLLLPESVRGKDNKEFLKYFRGLYVRAAQLNVFNVREPGAIMYVDLGGLDTKLTLYYSKMGTDGTYFKKSFDFRVSSAALSFHDVQRTQFEGTRFGREVLAPVAMHEYEFVQSGAFVDMFVKFPYLQNLGKVGINKAELILKADPATLGAKIGTSYRYEPPVLALYQPDSTLLKPEFNTPITTKAIDRNTFTYDFNITAYVQSVLKGSVTNRGLIVRPLNASNTMNRVLVGGQNNPSLKPVLKIVYTTLPK